MRLLSCHIENFGKLHDYSIDFSDNLIVVCEENGWGKSTFAAFIRAMLYGLEGERKRSLEENERKKYKPWQGGVFGGQLLFEVNGKKYQISRIFRDKEANDEFELRDAQTNLPSKDYSNKIGEEIFKINRESFMRTIFIGQNACETTATDDINAKIGNLADNSNDLNNFDLASARLTEIINSLTPNRISGSLAKRKTEIAIDERIVKNGQNIAESIDNYQKYLHSEEDNYNELKIQLKEAGENQTKVSKQQALNAKKMEWSRLKKAVSDKSDDVRTIGANIPQDVPKIEEIKTGIAMCGNMNKVYERVLMYRLDDSEKEELSGLSLAFSGGVPKDEDIENKILKTSRLRKIEQEINADQMSQSEKERLEELEPYFNNEQYNVSYITGNWNIRNNKKTALPSTQAALTTLRASASAQSNKNVGINPLLLLGVIVCVLSIALWIMISQLLGIAIVAVGIILILIGILENNKKKPEVIQPEILQEIENLSRIIEEDSAFISKVDAETEDYLESHGRTFDENFVSAMLQEIMAESVEYASLKKKKEKSSDTTKTMELNALKREITDFLHQFQVLSSEANFSDDLYALKTNVSRFLFLKDKKEKFEKSQSEFIMYHEDIVGFLNKYGYKPKQDFYNQLIDIQDVVNSYLNAENAQKIALSELKEFEANNDVSELNKTHIDEDLPSLEDINQTIIKLTEEMEKIHNTIVDYNKTLENLQEQYDEWEDKCIQLNDLKKIQEEEQKKYDLVSMAKLKLSVAKETMTAKYADPILEGFSKYYTMISGNDAGKFHVDANTTVTVDELGKQREVAAFSYGYRDIIGFCLRMALVDAMYQEEKPMIIMDDPFVNLDDKKINGGMQFLEEIAKKYQIIYFTCSYTRTL